MSNISLQRRQKCVLTQISADDFTVVRRAQLLAISAVHWCCLHHSQTLPCLLCRKKNKPGRLIQQYAPVLVVVELVILVVTVLVLRSSISHANKQIAQLRHDLQNSGLENGNLLVSPHPLCLLI